MKTFLNLLILLGLTSEAFGQQWLARVSQKGHSFLIDTRGKEFLPGTDLNLHDPHGRLIVANRDGEANYNLKSGLAPAFVGGKSGLMNFEGQLLIPVDYDYIGELEGGLFWLNQGGRTPRGCAMDKYHASGGKWGIVDQDGEWIIPIGLDEIYDREIGGYYAFSRAGKYGLLRPDGSLEEAFSLDDIFILGGYGGLLAVQKTGKWYQVEADQPWRPLDWPDDIGKKVRRTESGSGKGMGYLFFQQGKYHSKYGFRKENQDFWMDSLLQEVHFAGGSQAEFDRIGLQWQQNGDGAGLKDATGLDIVPPGLNSFEFIEKEFILWTKGSPDEAKKSDDFDESIPGLKGLISAEGKIILPARFTDIQIDLSAGRIRAENPEKKWELFDLKGKRISDQVFDDLDAFDQGLTKAKMGKTYGWIDLNGNWLFQDSNPLEWSFERNGIFWTSRNFPISHWLAFTGAGDTLYKTGGQLIPKPEEIRFMEKFPQWGQNLNEVRMTDDADRWIIGDFRNKAFGLMDSSGKWISPPQFKFLYPAGEGIFMAELAEREYLFLDRNGKRLSRKFKGFPSDPANGIFYSMNETEKGYRYCYYKLNGRPAFPGKFESARPFTLFDFK